MKIILLILYLGLHLNCSAQICPFYKKYLHKGDSAKNKANFQDAINAYSAAMLYCPSKSDEAQKKNLEVFNTIEKLKATAINERKRAKIAEKSALELNIIANEEKNRALEAEKNAQKAEIMAVNMRIIADIHTSHQILMNKYFDLVENDINDFFTNFWEPKFLKNFMNISKVMKILKEDPNPENVIFDFVEAGHVEMSKQKKSILALFEEAEMQSLTELNGAYDLLNEGQSTIVKLEPKEIFKKTTERWININKKLKDLLKNQANLDLVSLKEALKEVLK